MALAAGTLKWLLVPIITATSRESLDEGDFDTQYGCPLNEVENTITNWANS
ncbi:hypothetical protein BJ985_000036 [Corynebacterium tuberculostearicum]|nr:hypothetical protein [Corynebacterium tuberculostearicum]